MYHIRRDTLIERLIQFRLKKQLTHERLAVRLGVSRITTTRWLNRRVHPNALHRYRIEQLLKTR